MGITASHPSGVAATGNSPGATTQLTGITASDPSGVAATNPHTHAASLSHMVWFIAPLHILSALLLVFLVLLHSGKGGGLSDMFGGGLGAQAAGSTVVERNLDRITVVAALIFAFASTAFALVA